MRGLHLNVSSFFSVKVSIKVTASKQNKVVSIKVTASKQNKVVTKSYQHQSYRTNSKLQSTRSTFKIFQIRFVVARTIPFSKFRFTVSTLAGSYIEFIHERNTEITAKNTLKTSLLHLKQEFMSKLSTDT
ncbi:hypothetical protein CEXT_713581 [Caerostris extrusa]|uniref:Uncharacterized protein n=1 Tax=Caerostris extrusa TaxID=172846 RepID=A0AAV4N5V5_CAEEX|nr:hypothetical protein CEXT_713581 [Caerostris extrusa]